MTAPTRTPPTLVSIVIPVFNGLPLLDEQLRALAGQDYPDPFEVIICDNGSTDGLRAHLANHPLAERLRLRYLDASGRSGPSYARNVGIAAAAGDFLAFIDADDRVHPGWLSGMIKAAADFDAVGGASEVESLNSPKVATWRPMPAPDKLLETHYLPFANGNNIGFWRSTLDRIGGYDEDLITGEDVDISWRVQQSGLTLGAAPDALTAYRLRPTLRGVWRQAYGYGLGMPQVYVKHRPNGFRRLPLRGVLMTIAIVFLHNPVLPLTRHRVSTGLWVLHTGVVAGRLRGSLRHRTFYV